MASQGRSTDDTENRELLALIGAIATGDSDEVAQRLDSSPGLASRPILIGANRHDSETHFLTAVRHYVYAGDTALHFAAAAYRRDLAETLVAKGADVHARNRRGAEPLHYAADGSPSSEQWNPVRQREVIAYLIAAGADPDALDTSGIAPLHRAVRNRSSAAADALLVAGADPLLRNRRGSTPLHLAVQNTGKSGSGTDAAHVEQRQLIALLLHHGAGPADVDDRGRSVEDAASSDWIRQLLGAM